MTRVICLLICLAAWTARAADPAHKVAILSLTWHDEARNRDVPVEIYDPEDITTPCPLIVFSHGLGGNRYGYSYLGQYWAEHGYICVHVQHLGSDDAVWRGAGFAAFSKLKEAAVDPANAVNRAADVSFAITRMLHLNDLRNLAGQDPFRGRIDENKIGVAGHSFGAWTTLAIVGETNPAGKDFTDKRVKAAIAMSAPVQTEVIAAHQFAAIKVPVFHMTGTKDDSPIGETKAADRRVPYDQTTTPGNCLLVLNGADHMTFSGHAFGAYRTDDERFQRLILAGSTAFWDAMLRGDKAKRDWLYHGGFAKMLGDQGTFECR